MWHWPGAIAEGNGTTDLRRIRAESTGSPWLGKAQVLLAPEPASDIAHGAVQPLARDVAAAPVWAWSPEHRSKWHWLVPMGINGSWNVRNRSLIQGFNVQLISKILSQITKLDIYIYIHIYTYICIIPTPWNPLVEVDVCILGAKTVYWKHYSY